ncbi:RING-type E3 ubiquitin transferase [Sarracenia purpurea var. burkii]
MASSSKPQKDLDDPLKQEKEEEKEGDWLELGLGLGSFCGKPVNRSSLASVSASSSSLSFPLQQTLHQSGLKLGLGIDNESPARCESLSALPGNYDLYHHDNNTRPSFAFLTSPTSLSSWPWHVDSNSFLAHQNNRLIPVPAETHCYYGRSQSGLWFTLRSSTNRDENVTVFMVKTYLVRKLGLSNEAECLLDVRTSET